MCTAAIFAMELMIFGGIDCDAVTVTAAGERKRKRRKFNIRTFSYAARETFMRAIKVDAACLLSFLSCREASS